MSLFFRKRPDDQELIHRLKLGGDVGEKAEDDLHDRYENAIVKTLRTGGIAKTTATEAFNGGAAEVIRQIRGGSYPDKRSLEHYLKNAAVAALPDLELANLYKPDTKLAEIAGVQIVEKCGPPMKNTIRKVLSGNSWEKVEEVYSIAMESLLSNLKKEKYLGKEKATLITYATRIAKYKAIDYIRKKKPGENDPLFDLPEPDEEEDAEEIKEKVKKILICFDQLDPVCQKMLELRIEGMSWLRVAEELNRLAVGGKKDWTAHKAKMKWSRCRKALEDLLKK